MILVVVGGFIGVFAGGFGGLLLGAGLGFVASQLLQRSFFGRLRVTQNQLLESTFATMGAICKADGVVAHAEINMVEQIFTMLRLSEEQRAQAKTAFNRGKQPDFDLDQAVDGFAALVRGRGALLQLFLQLQCMAIAADGRVDAAEHAMLVRIARRLGLGEHDVRQLEALLRAATSGSTTGAGPEASASRLDDAYVALGVTAAATDSEIKRAYRKLISKNHPDKLAARGLPQSMRAVAEERSRELNKAYDLIKAARGIV